MDDPQVVSRDEWLAARRQLLAKEKEFTRQRDALNAERRRLPMVAVDKEYVFEGSDGKASLLDLFEDRGQLLIYHFMFDPDWDEGCPSCSFLADNIGHLAHLHARDTTLVLVSRAPLAKIEPFRRRMGWTVPWYSSSGSDFNYDFHVTLDQAVAPVEYNYRGLAELGPQWQGWSGEMHGISAFLRHGDRVFHTYSSYALERRLRRGGRRREPFPSQEVQDLGDQGGMCGAVPGVALQQARRGLEQEEQLHALGLSQIERALQGPLGGGWLAERVPGDRL